MYMTPTEHEKAEFSRMAQAMYAQGNNTAGHQFSAAASLPRNGQMRVAYFYNLKAAYRAWLCFNEAPTARVEG